MLAAGLAPHAGLPLHAGRPASPPCFRWRANAAGADRPVAAYVVSEDGEGWRSALVPLDATGWRRSIKRWKAGRPHQPDRHTVYGELRYTLTAGDRWKIWKSGKLIAETAKELAQ